MTLLHRSLCICALIPRVVTRTHVVLLVHQLEANKPTSTGVLAARCLPNSQVVPSWQRPRPARGCGHRCRRGAFDRASRRRPSDARPLLLLSAARTRFRSTRLEPGPASSVAGRSRRDLATGGAESRRTSRRRLGIPCVEASRDRSLPGLRRLRAASRGDRLATAEALAAALRALEGPRGRPRG